MDFPIEKSKMCWQKNIAYLYKKNKTLERKIFQS